MNPIAAADRYKILAVLGVTGTLLLTSCASGETGQDDADRTVTLTNCGEEVTYEIPVENMLVNDGNMIDLILTLGAQEQVEAVTNASRHEEVLRWRHGDTFAALREVADSSPSFETVIAADPDLVFAGWNYGFRESTGLTPEALAQYDIASYILSESCRSGEDGERGIMDPWDALRTDVRNIGALTGRDGDAAQVVADLNERIAALQAAPAPEIPVDALLFDSFTSTVTTSGRFGGPQAIIEAAGAHNIVSDLDDTWTQVSWERITSSEPDVIFFVDYPPQTVEQKVAELKANPATRDLEAVRQNRFVNLPYVMWTSGPMNIDAAEILRRALERYELAPESTITPAVDISTLGLAGNPWISD
ncbi:ABC transporter substrate-binding protein [Rhodococcus pyridinivorans]|uniref:ABC transporter substrate-binding protein n=1 Tax=Rhodococcus pyridinivorans TaxID=103816 RepID=UPI001C3008B2|nr:ABC transporter substrate-binding protein [Rhodococcus pyridinivorans]